MQHCASWTFLQPHRRRRGTVYLEVCRRQNGSGFGQVVCLAVTVNAGDTCYQARGLIPDLPGNTNFPFTRQGHSGQSYRVAVLSGSPAFWYVISVCPLCSVRPLLLIRSIWLHRSSHFPISDCYLRKKACHPS